MGHLADRELYRKQMNLEVRAKFDRTRRLTGKTTGQLLKIIGTALQIPETDIPIKDFEPYNPILKGRLHLQYRWLLPMLKDLITKLGLEGMIIKKNDPGSRRSDWSLRYEYQFVQRKPTVNEKRRARKRSVGSD